MSAFFQLEICSDSKKGNHVSSLLTVTCNIKKKKKALQNGIETKIKKLLILGVYAPAI